MKKKPTGFWIPMVTAKQIRKDTCGIWIPYRQAVSPAASAVPPKSKPKRKAIWIPYDQFVSMAQEARLGSSVEASGIWIPMARLPKATGEAKAAMKSSSTEGIQIGVVSTEVKAAGTEIKSTKPEGIVIPMAALASASVFKTR